MALGSTQPLTEMSTRIFPGGKGGRCVRLTTLPPSCAVVTKSGSLNFLEPSGPVQACNGTDLSFPFTERYYSMGSYIILIYYFIFHCKRNWIPLSTNFLYINKIFFIGLMMTVETYIHTVIYCIHYITILLLRTVGT